MQSFEQSKITTYFKNAIKDKSVRHSYIISGAKGLGKKHLADDVCLSFACEKSEGCGACPSCLSVKSGANPDVLSLVSKDNKEYTVDSVRDIISQVYKKPDGEYKLIVFKDAQNLGERCQNALLKTIEEPPLYAVFIFVCENKLSLLPTVRSRSLNFELHPWKKEELKNAFKVEGGREYLYDISGGNPLKLINMKDNPDFEKSRETAIKTMITLSEDSPYEVYTITDMWLSEKDSIDTLLDCLYLTLRDIMFLSFGQRDNLSNTDKLKDIQSIASKISPKTALSMTETVADFIANMSKYDNLTMAIQTMFMRIKEEIND